MKKNCIKELCKKSFENRLCETLHTIEKDHLCFCKNSANQIIIFINSKVVYFKKLPHETLM